MGIRYINADPNLNFTRPTGFVFPTGLNGIITSNTVVDYLVVAGGGGGNGGLGGGGGAGGFRQGSSFSVVASTPYSVTIGAGAPGADGVLASRGGNSAFGTITTEGGGGGNGATGSSQARQGGSGGSGGGSGGDTASPSGGLANTAVPQGNNGSNPSPAGNGTISGAGGGAGAAGGTPSNGYGGSGLTNSFLSTTQASTISVGQVSGPLVYYAGGGTGSIASDNPYGPAPGIAGGLGGGGRGAKSPATGGSGTNNTGGGGGATYGYAEGAGASGGSGVVIIRYLGSQAATGGANVTSSGGYTVHTFTGDGTFTTNSDFGLQFSGYSIN
jgi:hypothetical protein